MPRLMIRCTADCVAQTAYSIRSSCFWRDCRARLNGMNVNLAERAHNHNWKLDPIVRSLLDTDFYKLLMLQFIWKNFPAIHVTSEVTNRTVSVRLAEQIPMAMLVDQMAHVRGLRFRRSESSGLAGN